MIIEHEGKRYMELTRECIDTTRISVRLAQVHVDTAKRVGTSVSTGIRLALRHCAASEPPRFGRPGVVVTGGYRRIGITITQGSKAEALAISKTSVVDGIREALEHAKSRMEGRSGTLTW